MDGLTERLLAMARGASHEQQDYLEVIERVLDQRQVDFDALAAEALDHFLESGLDRDIGLVGVATVRISAIVDACFRLIVDGVSAPSWTRGGCAQAKCSMYLSRPRSV